MWSAGLTVRFHQAEGIIFYSVTNESFLEKYETIFGLFQKLGIPSPLDSWFNAPLAPDIIGTDAGERLTGDWRDDFIWGKAGDDRLSGGHGEDFLIGGAGADTFIGGLGNDRFVVGGEGDVILDFRPGDKIKIIHTNKEDEISFADGMLMVDGEVKVTLLGVDTFDLSQASLSVPNYIPQV